MSVTGRCVEFVISAVAMAAWDLQRCRMCCSCGSLASTPGYNTFEVSYASGQSIRPAGGLLKLTLRKRYVWKQLRTRAITRSLYSPLVESFESAKRKSSNVLNSGEKVSESGSLSDSSPRLGSPQHQEQPESSVSEAEVGDDSSQPGPQDPVAAAYGDGAHAEKLVDMDVKKSSRARARARARSARARPPSMSLSQGLATVGRHAVSQTVGAVGNPVHRAKVPGPIGLMMALAVAVLGLKTAVEKQGALSGTPQKLCEKCDGYGVRPCHVCKGLGTLTWEGKLLHTDPCPLCFGRCVKKCSSCGGVKIKRGPPPALLQPQLNVGSNSK